MAAFPQSTPASALETRGIRMKKLLSLIGYLFVIIVAMAGTLMVYHMWQLSQPGRGNPTLREAPWQAKRSAGMNAETVPSPSVGKSPNPAGR